MSVKNEKSLPNHVAIIMDGNRRWARQRRLPEVMGHKKVAQERVEELIEHAGSVGIPYITFWAFSTENWKREEMEVGGLMNLFRWSLGKKAKKIVEKGAKVQYIGDLSRFPEDLQQGFRELVDKSKDNSKIMVTFALNYGGRDELIRAIIKLIESRSQKSKVKTQDITEELLETHLDTVGMPDPDLIIRTGGEQRLSGFMPWQSVYAELYFAEVMMPDFGKKEMDKALDEYGKRKRRYGG